MPTRSILMRAALALVLLTGLVVLADRGARHEVEQAVQATAMGAGAVVVQTTGAIR